MKTNYLTHKKWSIKCLLIIAILAYSPFIDNIKGESISKSSDSAPISQKESVVNSGAAKTVKNENDKMVEKDHSHGNLSIKKGERLFFGTLPTGSGTSTCVSCHNVVKSDTFNWNPSAYEIAILYKNKNIESLKSALLTPGGKRMSVAHAGYSLNDEQITNIKEYLDSFANKGELKKKININRLLIFFGCGLLILLVLVDLIFTHYIKFRPLHLVLLLGASVFIVKILVEDAVAIGRSQGYSPDQPIKFSHEVHAKQNKIDCKYCHNISEISKSAGIPSTNVCMNCHIIVREGANSGSFEINKIIASNNTMKAIEWIRIHKLPDHVFFSHSQHVNAGKIECKTCHGEVEGMNRVVQYSDLSMGWCVNCHRETEVQFFNNDFYKKYESLHKQFKEGKIEHVTAEMIGANDCMKCHY